LCARHFPKTKFGSTPQFLGIRGARIFFLEKSVHASKKFGARQKKSLCVQHFPKTKFSSTYQFLGIRVARIFVLKKSVHATKKFDARQKKVCVRDIFQNPNLVQLINFWESEGLAFLF
jgi:hypothetical protein